MAVVELPPPRRVFLTFLLVVAAYSAALPLWMRALGPYSRVVAWTATTIGFPLVSQKGAVESNPGRSVSLTYILPDPRTGGWGKCRQRLLNFADVPLAVAVSFGLGFLALGRRALAAGAALLFLFLCHVTLVVWSARKLAGFLTRTDLSPAELDPLIGRAAVSANEFGDVSPILGLAVLGLAAALLHRDRR
jgi:hypothetical protein